MTVKLELKPEVEAGLITQAHARGLSLEAYLDQVLQNAADVFVVERSEEWAVKEPHAGRVSDVVPAQEQAVGPARELARRPASRKSLAQLFAESPFRGLDLSFERDPDTGRPVKL